MDNYTTHQILTPHRANLRPLKNRDPNFPDVKLILGEAEITQISGEAVNLDNLKQNGKYRLANCTLTGTGVQSSELNKSNCDVIVFESGYNDVIQLISFYNTEVCYQRLFWYNTESWFATRMYSIPSFYKNYNDLGSLASALGGFYMETASVNTIGGQWVTVPNISSDHGGLWCLWLVNETVSKIYFIISSNKLNVLNESWYSVELQFVGTSLQIKYNDYLTVNFGRLN